MSRNSDDINVKAVSSQQGDDPLFWFPMRVTYCQELKVKEALDQEGIENFLPMSYQVVDIDGSRHRELVPAIHNLIFVHSTRERITHLKMYNKAFEPIRYIMSSSHSDMVRPEILTISNREMDNFIRVASVTDDSVMFLNWSSMADKVSRRVMVVDGPFAGVEGVIMRIYRNKHVVVQLKGIAAVAITFVPPAFLKLLDTNG